MPAVDNGKPGNERSFIVIAIHAAPMEV